MGFVSPTYMSSKMNLESHRSAFVSWWGWGNFYSFIWGHDRWVCLCRCDSSFDVSVWEYRRNFSCMMNDYYVNYINFYWLLQVFILLLSFICLFFLFALTSHLAPFPYISPKLNLAFFSIPIVSYCSNAVGVLYFLVSLWLLFYCVLNCLQTQNYTLAYST